MTQPVDTTGWSKEWKNRLATADSGLSVRKDTPRGASERRFLALWDGQDKRTFRGLCKDVGAPPNDSWGSVERWVKDLLMDLKRVGSLRYDKQTRQWFRTELGAAAADTTATNPWERS